MNIKGLSALLFALEYHEEHKTIEETIQRWYNILKALHTEKCWADGKHCGDCTKEPATCYRCLVGEFVNRAAHLKYESDLDVDHPEWLKRTLRMVKASYATEDEKDLRDLEQELKNPENDGPPVLWEDLKKDLDI